MPGAIKRGGLSRRKFVALAGAAAAGAPFLNLGNYRLFADSPAVYSDRAIALVNESLVIDMLSLLDMGRLESRKVVLRREWQHLEETFLAAHLEGALVLRRLHRHGPADLESRRQERLHLPGRGP